MNQNNCPQAFKLIFCYFPDTERILRKVCTSRHGEWNVAVGKDTVARLTSLKC